MVSIIDTPIDTTPHLSAFKAAGIKTIIRYLSPINPKGEKCIKPGEAEAIAKAGLRLALVCEGWGNFAHGAISAGAGERDGEWCTKYAPTVGAPADASIAYAVDADASVEQINKLVLPYFTSITAAHAAAAIKYRRTVYGSGNVLTAVLGAHLADLDWLSCSLGWSGSRNYLARGKMILRQYPPEKVCGIDCDPDNAIGDFGDFVPFTTAPSVAMPVISPPMPAPTTSIAADAIARIKAILAEV
jgi:Domain of unknown function (DUF1906)